MMKTAICALLLLGLPQDPDAGAVTLKWKLAKFDFARLKSTNPARAAGLFGYEIEDGLRYKSAPVEDRYIPLSLAWTLPAKALAVDDSVSFTTDFDYFTYGPITVKGTVTRRKSVTIDGASCIELAYSGTVTPKVGGTGGTVGLAMKTGSFEATVAFDNSLGLARKTHFTWSYTYTIAATGTDLSERMDEEFTYVKTLHLRGSEFEGEVNTAIDNGIQYLWKKFDDATGHWQSFNEEGPARSQEYGPSALALLAILKGSNDRRDPRLKKALDWILAQPIKRTYEVAIALLVLEAWYSPHDPEARFKGETVVATNLGKGIDKQHLQWALEAERFLERTQLPDGMWTYPYDDVVIPVGDYSNTQYGILGMFAAANLGVPVDPRSAHKILKTLLQDQEEAGPKVKLMRAAQSKHKKGETKSTGVSEPAMARGWGYGRREGRPGPFGSMTLNGIASLTILDSILRRARFGGYTAQDQAKVVAGKRDGWAWMQESWSVRSNATSPLSPPAIGECWYSYTIYAMERASMLTGLGTLGGHDWYWEGAEVLISNQQLPEGNWFTTLWDTSFCILFLKRATYYVPVATGR